MRTRSISIAVALLALAATAVALPPSHPWAGEQGRNGYDYTYPHLYLDARLEASVGAECLATFGAPGSAAVCADVGVWEDLNGDGMIDASEWTPRCVPDFEVLLTPSTGSWGTFGVYLLNANVWVFSGPIQVRMGPCDPATGHYHGDEILVFPVGKEPVYDIVLETETVCLTFPSNGIDVTHCVSDAKAY